MSDKKTSSQQFTPLRGAGQNSTMDIENRWDELRSKIRKEWPTLSKSDLEMIDGDSRKLVALVHQKTGADVSEIESKIDEIAATSEGLLCRLTRNVQSAASQASQSVTEPVAYAYHSLEHQVANNPIRSSGIAFGIGLVVGVCTASIMKDSFAPRRHSAFRLW